MSESESKACNVTKGIINVVCKILVIWLLFTAVINTLSIGTDDTDYSGWKRSGMSLHTDNATGMQYLSVSGAITPRLDRVGNHMNIRD